MCHLIACSKNTALTLIVLTKCNTNLVTRKHEPDADVGGATVKVTGPKAWKVSIMTVKERLRNWATVRVTEDVMQ